MNLKGEIKKYAAGREKEGVGVWERWVGEREGGCSRQKGGIHQ